MLPFEELGQAVGAQWKRHNYDEKAFPAIATELLTDARLHERVDPVDIIRWITTNEIPPAQGDSGTFGEPPIVVYRGRRFYIEVLYWLDGTTLIHQHGFSGAFGVLAGESIETSYSLRVERRINSRMLLCDIAPERVELLRTGAVHDIVAGEAGAHALFHLARPSVSVVVRTISEIEAQPQYLYLKPFVAVDPFAQDPIIDRRVRSLQVLLATEDRRFDDVAAAAINNADLELAFYILQRVHASEGRSDRYARLAAHAASHHGDVIERFTAVHAEQARERSIIAMRATIHDPDHRFFLALLLNVPVRAMVLQLVRERFPGDEPEAKIQMWLRQLSGSDGIGLEIDEMTLSLCRLLAVPRTLDDVLESINADVERGAYKTTGRRVMEQYHRLKASPILRPLISA